MYRKQRNMKGFIKTIIIIIVALVILQFVFNITIQEIISSKFVKDLISILKSIFELLWDATIIVLDFIKMSFVKLQEFISGFKK